MLGRIKALVTGSASVAVTGVFKGISKDHPKEAELLSTFVTSGKPAGALSGLAHDIPRDIEWRCSNLEAFATDTDRLSYDQWVRLGKVFALTPSLTKLAAKWPDVPAWFLAIQHGRQMSRKTTVWDPRFLQAVLLDWGADAGQIPQVIIEAFVACLEHRYSWDSPTKAWKQDKNSDQARGFVAYMKDNIAMLPGVCAKASAAARVDVIEWLDIYPELARGLVPTLSAWIVDGSKTVRQAAVALVEDVGEPYRMQVFAAGLDQGSPANLATLVDHLSQSGDTALLEAALTEARGGKRDQILTRALDRTQAVGELPETSVDIPAAPPLDTTPLGTEFNRSLQAALNRWIATWEKAMAADPNPKRYKDALDSARNVTAADIEAIRDWLNGTRGEPKVDHTLWVLVRETKLPLLAATRYSIRRMKSRPLSLNTYVLKNAIGTDYDLRNLCEALTLAGIADPVGEVTRMIFSWNGLNGRNPDQVWPFFAEHPEGLERGLGMIRQSNTDFTPDKTRTALRILAMFPTVPSMYLPVLARLATAETKNYRREAQELLERQPDSLSIAVQTLSDGKGEVRAAGARWIGRIGNVNGIEPLREALAKEKREQPEAAMLNALRVLGDDISAHLTPEVLAAGAKKGLAGKKPAGMEWVPLDALPACRWADGTDVDPDIIRWWAILGVKMKDPLGAGLIPLYVSLLDKESQEALGVFVLDSWIAQDTRNPSDDDCRAYAQATVDYRYNQYQEWAKRYPGSYGAKGLMTKDEVFEELRRDKSKELIGSAIGEKGLLALTVGAPGHYVYATAQRYIRDFGRRRAQVEALVTAASGNDDPAAIQLVLSVARKYKQETVRLKAAELAGEIAERRGWSLDELADRTIPTAGFDETGVLTLDFGPRSFTGRVARSPKTGAYTIALSNPDGKPISALPKPGASDDQEMASESRKQLTTSKKELGQVVSSQTSRLFEAMCLGRVWDAPSWQEYLLGHPIVCHLVSTLVWKRFFGEDGGYQLFRPTLDKELLDIDDETISLGEADRIGLAHLATVTADEAERWKSHLSDYEVVPVFAQFDSVLPPIEPGMTMVEDHLGWLSDSFAIRGRATKRGYVRGQAEDAGWFSEYDKDLPSAEIRVEISFTGSMLPEQQVAAAVERLSFLRSGRVMPLTDVPPILLAESYADYVVHR